MDPTPLLGAYQSPYARGASAVTREAFGGLKSGLARYYTVWRVVSHISSGTASCPPPALHIDHLPFQGSDCGCLYPPAILAISQNPSCQPRIQAPAIASNHPPSPPRLRSSARPRIISLMIFSLSHPFRLGSPYSLPARRIPSLSPTQPNPSAHEGSAAFTPPSPIASLPTNTHGDVG